MGSTSARWAVIAAVGLIGLAAGIYFGTETTPHQEPIAAAALSGLALPDADGTEQRIDQWRGKVVIVNFWATWCAPCREEMPEFVKAQKDLGPKGLQIVGIAVDQADKVRQFAAEIGLNYPTLVGGFRGDGALQDFGQHRDGAAVYRDRGPPGSHCAHPARRPQAGQAERHRSAIALISGRLDPLRKKVRQRRTSTCGIAGQFTIIRGKLRPRRPKQGSATPLPIQSSDKAAGRNIAR